MCTPSQTKLSSYHVNVWLLWIQQDPIYYRYCQRIWIPLVAGLHQLDLHLTPHLNSLIKGHSILLHLSASVTCHLTVLCAGIFYTICACKVTYPSLATDLGYILLYCVSAVLLRLALNSASTDKRYHCQYTC